jgi:hypothetical protein
MGGVRSKHGRDENAYRILVGNPDGKGPNGRLGRDRLKWILNK